MRRFAKLWILVICCIPSLEALKCYGAEAFQRSHNGELDCYKQSGVSDVGFRNPCWSKCGGVTFFMNAIEDDPSGKELCPYIENRHRRYTSGSTEIMPCNCSMWRHPLPTGECPKCDDFNAIPPLMLSTSRDAATAGIELGVCPPGYDTCFNYCVNGDEARQESNNQCAYGCAKMASQPILDLMIATKLAELDRVKNMKMQREAGNPVEYVCKGWALGCSQTLCHADGCNGRSALPELRGWAQVYLARWVQCGLVLFACAFAFCPLLRDLYKERRLYAAL